MRRVLLIGPGGAGKSTLAREIAERCRLPLLHLDALYWQPGWVQPDAAEWRSRLESLLQGEAWVMDGNFGGSLEQRLAACDTAILLDLPPWLCLRRVLLRRWRHRGRRVRPDMRDGCPERLDPGFVFWILSYRWRKRPTVLRRLQAAAARGVRIVLLDSPQAVRAFSAALPAA